MKKFFLILLSVVVVLILFLVIFVNLSWDKEFDYEYPDIHASNDPEIIAYGEYLAYGPAHCATCHVPSDKIINVENGEKLALIGGWELDIPPGVFRAPNLTPDKETGIGNMTDGQLARALRHSVTHDNKFMLPLMPFQNLSDEDLVAVISFLRSQKPVKNKVERTEYTFLGKALLAFGVLQPEQPKGTPPKKVNKEASKEYGEYLAKSVANCVGCHTARDLKTGEFIGPDFAGGMHFLPEPLSEGYSFITPNITPDEKTGVFAKYTEDGFLEKFRKGRITRGTPMPWGAYSRMTENDIKSIYMYLKSLNPIENLIEKTIFAPGEELPS